MPNKGAGSRLKSDPNEIKVAPKSRGAQARHT
jgi:hypothetical protein